MSYTDKTETGLERARFIIQDLFLSQRLFNLLRSCFIAFRRDLRSLRCVFRLQDNGALHQEGDNTSAVIWDEKGTDGPLRMENIEDRLAQAFDRAAFLGT